MATFAFAQSTSCYIRRAGAHRSSLARQSVQKIEEAAAAKLKAEEDAAKEKLDCFLVAGLLYFSASDLLRMGMEIVHPLKASATVTVTLICL